MSLGMVAFVVGAFILGMCVGVMANEHMNRPLLTNDELLDATDRIVVIARGDHDKVRMLLDELCRWMKAETDFGEMSDELGNILKIVQSK